MKTEKLDYRNGDDDDHDRDDGDDVDDDSIVWLVGEVSWPDRLWTAGLCLAHHQPPQTTTSAIFYVIIHIIFNLYNDYIIYIIIWALLKCRFSNIIIVITVFERMKNTNYSFL